MQGCQGAIAAGHRGPPFCRLIEYLTWGGVPQCGVLIIRIVIYWDLYWGPLYFGKLPYFFHSKEPMSINHVMENIDCSSFGTE